MANRNDIITRMQENLSQVGIEASKKDCEQSLDAALNAVADVAEEHGSVRTVIGTFKVSERAARDNARNPLTGETISIAGSKRLAFTAAKARVHRDGEEAAPKTAPKAKAAAPKVAAKTTGPKKIAKKK